MTLKESQEAYGQHLDHCGTCMVHDGELCDEGFALWREKCDLEDAHKENED